MKLKIFIFILLFLSTNSYAKNDLFSSEKSPKKMIENFYKKLHEVDYDFPQDEDLFLQVISEPLKSLYLQERKEEYKYSMKCKYSDKLHFFKLQAIKQDGEWKISNFYFKNLPKDGLTNFLKINLSKK